MPITNQELGRRLRAASEACGLTQEVVAQRLGVSRPTVTQMELGNRAITSIELERLATLYGCDIHDFFADPEDALAALFRAEPAFAQQQPIVESLRSCLVIAQQVTTLETMLDLHRNVVHYSTSGPSSQWKAIREGEIAANQERSRLGLGWAPLPSLTQILEMQGVRTGVVNLPLEISGLTINHPSVGLFIVANSNHPPLRRRFSFTHEYAHVLFDRRLKGIVTRTQNRDDLVEIRANSFAAAFLMPEGGVRQFLNSIGNGRSPAQVFDGEDFVLAEGRSSQDLQLYDVVHLAHYFGINHLAALSRLRNLRLLTQAEFDRLRLSAKGSQIAKPDVKDGEDSRSFRHRILHLGLEAYRRNLITLTKLTELAQLISISDALIGQLVEILDKEV